MWGMTNPTFTAAQKAVYAFLQEQHSAGSLAQAYAVEGPAESGRRTVIANFMCRVAGLSTLPPRGALTMPLVYYRGEEKMTMPAIRALRSWLRLSVPSTSMRFVVFGAADRMEVAAANALLKMIEEAPRRTCFFFVSVPGALISTIRSRCVGLRVYPESPQALVDTFGFTEAQALASAGLIGRRTATPVPTSLESLFAASEDPECQLHALMLSLRQRIIMSDQPTKNRFFAVLSQLLDAPKNSATYKMQLENAYVQLAH